MQNANFADIFQFRLFGDCLMSTGTAVNICKYKYLTAAVALTL
jgi:hypothetical protein